MKRDGSGRWDMLHIIHNSNLLFYKTTLRSVWKSPRLNVYTPKQATYVERLSIRFIRNLHKEVRSDTSSMRHNLLMSFRSNNLEMKKTLIDPSYIWSRKFQYFQYWNQESLYMTRNGGRGDKGEKEHNLLPRKALDEIKRIYVYKVGAWLEAGEGEKRSRCCRISSWKKQSKIG